jgi:YhfZ C-terminal domain/Helix-turn-helix domain
MMVAPLPGGIGSPAEVGMSKNLMAVQLVARDLLTRVQGERIPTALQYQQLTGVGSGTVQKALRTLQGVGAVSLRSRGHAGTLLLRMDLPKLWALAALGAPTAVLPVPVFPEMVGFARALRLELKRLGIPYQAIYSYGSSRRLALVESGEADFTALSAAAAEEVVTKSGGGWFASALSPNSYYYQRSWVVITRPGIDPYDRNSIRRVGIDRNSHDATVVTEAEFPTSDGYKHIDGDYTYMPARIATGKLDAMVWHKSVLAIPLEAAGIKSRPLEAPQTSRLLKQMSTAMLVAKSTRPELKRMFELLDRASFASIQREVRTGNILPFY